MPFRIDRMRRAVAFVREIPAPLQVSFDTRPITFYASLTALFLFLTLKVVESRRWR